MSALRTIYTVLAYRHVARTVLGSKQKFGGQRKFVGEQINVFRQEVFEILLKMTFN